MPVCKNTSLPAAIVLLQETRYAVNMPEYGLFDVIIIN
jgi:hypothetical protein